MSDNTDDMNDLVLLAMALDEAVSKVKELEAKLERAVAQMQRVKDFRYDPNIGIELNLLEATLAALKGQDNE